MNDPLQKNSLKFHYLKKILQKEPLTCENLSPNIKTKNIVD